MFSGSEGIPNVWRNQIIVNSGPPTKTLQLASHNSNPNTYTWLLLRSLLILPSRLRQNSPVIYSRRILSLEYKIYFLTLRCDIYKEYDI